MDKMIKKVRVEKKEEKFLLGSEGQIRYPME